jgi:hypothetical protein
MTKTKLDKLVARARLAREAEDCHASAPVGTASWRAAGALSEHLFTAAGDAEAEALGRPQYLVDLQRRKAKFEAWSAGTGLEECVA